MAASTAVRTPARHGSASTRCRSTAPSCRLACIPPIPNRSTSARATRAKFSAPKTAARPGPRCPFRDRSKTSTRWPAADRTGRDRPTCHPRALGRPGSVAGDGGSGERCLAQTLYRPAQPRIEQVADAVAQQVEGENRDGDGEPGEQHQPPRWNEPGIECVGQHIAPGRRRRRDADAEETQRCFDDDGNSKVGRRQDQEGGNALRQDMPEHQANVGGPEAARSLHERHLFERQDYGAYHAPPERYPRDGNRHDDRAGAGTQRHGNRHGEHEIGEGLHEFDGALARDVKAPAEEPAGKTPQAAERGPEQHGAERHRERRAAAPHDAAQRIAADLIGAEAVFDARWFRHDPEVRFERVVGGDGGGGDGHGDDSHSDKPPERRHGRATHEDAQRACGAAPARGRPQCCGRRLRPRWVARIQVGRSDGHLSRILGSNQAMMISTKRLSSTNTTAYRNTRFCMTNTSRSLTAVNMALPSPGVPNARSTGIDPASTKPNRMPDSVMTGSKALGKACSAMTSRLLSPLARAVRT